MSDVRFQTDGSTTVNGITVKTPYDNEGKNQSLTMADFLQLMIAEMKNQDFMGGGDSGGGQSGSAANYITQMAQMSTMQQMQELAYYSKTNYAMSLVGKQATVATLGIGGKVNKEVGIIEKVTLDNDEYLVYINGKGYSLSEIMNVGVPGAEDSETFEALSKVTPVVTKQQDDNFTVRWDAPKVSASEEEKVVYKVYISKDESLAAEKNPDAETIIKKAELVGTTEDKEGENRYYMDIKDLDPNETYYVNVIAISQSGAKYAYKTLKVEL